MYKPKITSTKEVGKRVHPLDALRNKKLQNTTASVGELGAQKLKVSSFVTHVLRISEKQITYLC